MSQVTTQPVLENHSCVSDLITAGADCRPSVKVQRSRPELFARVLYNFPKTLWAIADAGFVCLGNYIGYQVFHIQFPRSSWVAEPTLVNAVTAIAIVASGVVVGLYDSETLRHRTRIVIRSILTLALALSASYVVMHALMYEVFSRRIALIGAATFLCASGTIRLLANRMLLRLKLRVLFVGFGDSVKRVCEMVTHAEQGQHYVLAGFVSSDPRGTPCSIPRSLPYLGSIENIAPICRAHDIDEIVIGVEERIPQLSHMIMSSLRMGCRVTNQPTFHERVFEEIPAEYISPDWFLQADLDGHRQERVALKRVSDVVFSAPALALSLPLWPLIALAIWLEDRGPIFYSQERVGCHNRIFRLTKFRTMRPDAEADGHAWAVPGDPRVTRVGRFLRRTHLDELPQLFNILIGDMSVVGPRPERPEFVDQLIDQIPFYDERHLVKPGLTGWAQIKYRYGCSVEDSRKKLCLDLYYIKNISLELDLVIILRTLSTLFGSPA